MSNCIIDFLKKNLLSVLCIIGIVVELIYPGRFASILLYILGIIGFFYCAYYLLVFFCPPKRDWILVKGNYMNKVFNFVMLVPFVITLFVHCIYGTEFSPKNLIFDENLYKSEEVRTITLLSGADEEQRMLFAAHGLDAHGDTLVQKSKLPEEIKKAQEDPSLFWSIYCHFLDPGNQSMTTSQVGRNIAALVAALGILLLNGLLISTLISWFDRRREQWLKGDVRYNTLLRFKRSKNYVIIGGNDVVAGVIKMLYAGENNKKKSTDESAVPSKKGRFYNYLKSKLEFLSDKPYFIVQTSGDVENFRHKLFSQLDDAIQTRVIIYYGDRTSAEDLADLCPDKAQVLFILGEETRTDDFESYHDTMNMKCLALLKDVWGKSKTGKEISSLLAQIDEVDRKIEIISDEIEQKTLEEQKKGLTNSLDQLRPHRLNCRVMFEYQTTFSVFQFYDIGKNVEAFINFTPFNYYEAWAQKVLINKELDSKVVAGSYYQPLEGPSGIKKGSDEYVHLFIIGMSRMGIAMGVEAAHLAHYPNYEEKKIRTKITFIDKNAAEEKDFFMGRFKELFSLSHWRYVDVDGGELDRKMVHVPTGYDYLGGDFLDIEWEFINGGVESSAVQNYILSSATPQAKVTIAVCLPESNRAHAAALFLRKEIYESSSVKQVLVYNRYEKSIIDAITESGAEYPYCGKLKGFGSAAKFFTEDFLAFSKLMGDKVDDIYKNINVKSAYSPKSAKYKGKSSVSNQWSSQYNGNMLWTKLRCIEYDGSPFDANDEIVSILADVEHNRWNVEELLMNFRPLTREEQQKEIETSNINKNILKSRMAHLDICSNRRLMQIDEDARKYDEGLSKFLHQLYIDMSKCGI